MGLLSAVVGGSFLIESWGKTAPGPAFYIQKFVSWNFFFRSYCFSNCTNNLIDFRDVNSLYGIKNLRKKLFTKKRKRRDSDSLSENSTNIVSHKIRNGIVKIRGLFKKTLISDGLRCCILEEHKNIFLSILLWILG